MDAEHLLIAALDHAPLGLFAPLADIRALIRDIAAQRADGVVLNYGVARDALTTGIVPPRGVIVRVDGNRTFLGGSWMSSTEWTAFFGPEDVAALGAGGCAANLLLGAPSELESIRTVAAVTSGCARLGLTSVVSSIAFDPASDEREPVLTSDPEALIFAARYAFELGADVVNVYGQPSDTVLDAVSSNLPCRFVVAGGAPSPADPEALLDLAAAVGARPRGGLCLGRRLWDNAGAPMLIGSLRDALGRGPAELQPSAAE